jgi:RNA polymerase sigma factor (sigma-70 family)
VYELVVKACKGDGDAFTEAILLLQSSLYRVARSYLDSEEDIADALQETILKAWKGIAGLKQPEYFKTWLIRILINESIRIRRRKSTEYLVDPNPDPEENIIFQEMVSERQEWQPGQVLEFEDMMRMLSMPVREVLVLYYGEGYTAAEIAGLLHISEEAVRQRLSRGRREINEKYL